MPALSFSAIEILPNLLDKTKIQTIRPLWTDKPKRIAEADTPGAVNIISGTTGEPQQGYKEPRLKVGDVVVIYWKMRSKAKTFCAVCGKGIKNGAFQCSCVHDIKKDLWFNKLLGKVKITSVEEIEMVKSIPVIIHEYDEIKIYNNVKNPETEYNPNILAKADGFKSEKEFFIWFNSHYDLSTPKRYVVYRWLYD